MIWLMNLALFGRVVLAAAFPAPTGYVNDFAEVISPAVEEKLETRLEEFTSSTGNELAVVTLKSLEGDTVENVAVDLFEQWGIGQKDKDNGVLLLVAVDDRELRIEVGYGLEPVLNDARAGRIIRDDITPEFKSGSYDNGIAKGVDSIIAVVSGTAPAETTTSSADNTGKDIGIIFAVIAFLIYFSAYLGRSKSWWPGGVIGGILGYIVAAATGAILVGLIGLFLDFILSKNYKVRKANKRPTSWWSSMGGFSSGGSRGGFGGFSGGSSGGGGASGRW